MRHFLTDIKIEMELSSGVWTDVSEDVVQRFNIPVDQGWKSNSPVSRMADTGIMRFTLRSDSGCTGGVDGYYIPGHVNCRSGFQTGINVRLRVKPYYLDYRTEFYGKIPPLGITVQTGKVTTYVTVEVRDYMEQLMIHDMYLPEFTTSKDMSAVLPLIIANLPVAPLSTEYNTSEITFSTVFDTVKSKTKASTEIYKLCISEMGYAYIKVTSDSDEVFVGEGRMTRMDRAIAQVPDIDPSEDPILAEDGTELLAEDGTEILGDLLAVMGDAVFDNNMRSLATSSGRNYYNRVERKVYPRKIDASPVILAQNDKAIKIEAGQTVPLKFDYKDPDQLAVHVAGKDMIAPVMSPTASYDVKFTENEDGTGADWTSDLDVDYDYGVEGVEYEVTNNHATDGWLYLIQARGYGIYTYNPITSSKQDDDLVDAEGRITFVMDAKYDDDVSNSPGIIDQTLSIYKNKDTIVDEISFCPNYSEFLMLAFVYLTIGDRITIINDKAGINTDYFIIGRSFAIMKGGVINLTYYVSPAFYDSHEFWYLGETNYGELGQNTFLGSED